MERRTIERLWIMVFALVGCGHGAGNGPSTRQHAVAPPDAASRTPLLIDAGLPAAAQPPSPGCADAVQGSCTYSTGLDCEEWGGGSAQAADFRQQNCRSPDTYSNTACTHTNALGGCSFHVGDECETRWYYPPSDAATKRTNCEAAGNVWVTP